MIKKLACSALLLLTVGALLCNAQTDVLIIPKDIVFPGDSADTRMLCASLTSFLQKAEGPNEQNELMLPAARLETFVLANGIKGVTGKSERNSRSFCKPCLSSVTPINGRQYHVQVLYRSTDSNGNIPTAVFELIATQSDTCYQFSSPLSINSKGWKTSYIGSCIFHYQDTLDTIKASAYSQMAMEYDRKLRSANKHTELYCGDHLQQLEKLLGIAYRADHNGKRYGVLSARQAGRSLILLGNLNASFNRFDPHDLWHERLEFVIPRSKVNRAVDEGCAYLYGGSWGLGWNEIFAEFRRYVLVSNWLIDWREVKEHPVYFKIKGFDNSLDHLANALLIRKIEQKHGFAGVWELLLSGSQENGNAAYYAVLCKLTGITRVNYNQSIMALINEPQ